MKRHEQAKALRGEGLDYLAIAARMGISPHTVSALIQYNPRLRKVCT